MCVEKNPVLTSTEKNNLKKKVFQPPPIMKWSLPNDMLLETYYRQYSLVCVCSILLRL